MITTLVLALFGLLMLVVLLLAVRGQSGGVRSLLELEAYTQPVDLDAFRNLTDPQEERYLRERLTAKDFRCIQRQRLGAALGYVRRVAHNASILLRLGEAVRRNSDPEVARTAGELVESALRLRMYSLLAMGLLYARILLPSVGWSAAGVATGYQGLRDHVGRLSRLQAPAQAARISAAL
jgi:hypothetical protein